MKKYYQNVFTDAEIQSLLDEYNSPAATATNDDAPTMKKANPGPATEIIDKLTLTRLLLYLTKNTIRIVLRGVCTQVL